MNIKERIIESLLFLSSASSVGIIFVMAFYLFAEGLQVFWKSPVDDYAVIVVNEQNPVFELEPLQLKAIKDGALLNWKEISDFDAEIKFVTYTTYEGEKEVSKSQSAVLLDYVRGHKGAIGVVFGSDMEDDLGISVVSIPKVAITDFLFGELWYPTSEPIRFLGILPMILGSLLVTVGAIVIAVPISLGSAVYLSELASAPVRNVAKPVVELLAGIPSVVYGFFGLVVVVPFVRDLFGLDTGENGLSGAIVLALMVTPTIVSLSEDALKAVPVSLREASLSLGATKWQTIYKVVVPAGLSGISASVMLGVGRAIGETMAVLMVTGNAAVIPDGFLTSLRTLTATIAAELGEAPQGGLHFQSLFAIGSVLFVFTLLINIVADLVSRRYELKG